MGADGGSIPTRDELVKLKKKPERVGKDVELNSRWRVCALSAQTLREPVVACGLGRLYNKEAIIQHLLDKDKYGDQGLSVAHIRGLKDVTTLNLTHNKAFDESRAATTSGAYTDSNMVPFACPVTDVPMNGHYKFCFLKSCGCVFSDKALREIPGDACHKCGKAFTPEDVVSLNPSQAEEDEMWAALQKARASSKSKSDKKRKAEAPSAGPGSKKQKAAAQQDEIKGSDVFKSLFIDPKKRAEMEKQETFTARAVHRGYVA